MLKISEMELYLFGGNGNEKVSGFDLGRNEKCF